MWLNKGYSNYRDRVSGYTMTTTRIFADPATLRPGRLGPATGTLSIAIDGVEFPAQGWNDFILVILETWATALVRLLQGTSTTEVIHFMEGPFELTMAMISSDRIELVGRERGHAERAHVTVALATLVRSLYDNAEKVLDACREKAIWSVDAERLESAVLLLEKEARKLTDGYG